MRRLLAVGLVLLSANPALAATDGSDRRLTVSQRSGLDPAGTEVTVKGTGYDVEKGIYVAFCVNNGPGVLPTPCLGGVDTAGASGSSVWISSNPPDYGVGLAKPYGPGGSFTVRLLIKAQDAVTDCLDHAKAPNGCAIVTRADHTRADDRSEDVIVPIGFAPKAKPSPSKRPSPSPSPRPSPSPSPSPSPTEVVRASAPAPSAAPSPETSAAATAAPPSPVAAVEPAARNDGGMSALPVGLAAGAAVVVGGGTVLARRRR